MLKSSRGHDPAGEAIRRLLFGYAISSFGSWVSGIGIFLSIEPYFGVASGLAIALSLRTSGYMAIGLVTSKLLDNIKPSTFFISSQLLGALSLAAVYLGYVLHNFPLVMIGMVSTGIPAVAINTGLTAWMKNWTGNDVAVFRRWSSKRDLINGLCAIFASTIGPIIFQIAGIYPIILIDLATYIFALIFFINAYSKVKIDFKSHKTTEPFIRKSAFLVVADHRLLKYILKITASNILIATVPILASSNQTPIGLIISNEWRGNLWVIESLAAIGASYIYFWSSKRLNVFKDGKVLKPVEAIFVVNGILMLPLIYFKNATMLLAWLALNSFAMLFIAQVLRDDLMISAGTDKGLTNQFAGLAGSYRSLLMSISPFLVFFLFKNFEVHSIVLWLILFQGVIGISLPKILHASTSPWSASSHSVAKK